MDQRSFHSQLLGPLFRVHGTIVTVAADREQGESTVPSTRMENYEIVAPRVRIRLLSRRLFLRRNGLQVPFWRWWCQRIASGDRDMDQHQQYVKEVPEGR